MAGARRGLLDTVVLAPVLASCVALLDFDELSVGSGGAAGVGGGSGGAAGETAEAGQAGETGQGGAAGEATGGAGGAAARCADDCSDDDPCTVDSCELVDGEATCLNEFTPGLALDGVDETITADDHHRVTMVGGPDAFFYSVFSEDGGESDVVIYRLGATDDASEPIATLSSVNLAGAGNPASAAGLAIDDAVALRLHAFFGVENAVGTGARVWHVVFQADQWDAGVPVPVGESYLTAIPTNHPVAANIGGSIYGAWITELQNIELAGVGATNDTLSDATQATTLAMFDTSDNQPAVLYTGTGSGVFLESQTALLPVPECETTAGIYLSSSTVPTGIAGIHFASWTKAGDEFLVNESEIVACGPGGCLGEMNCDGGTDTPIRNTASATAELPGDPVGVVHYALASPFLAPGADPDSVDAGLVFQLIRIDFGPDPLAGSPESVEIGLPLEVARMPTDITFEGPDWPAVSYVEPDRIALAWLQPGDSGDELRVQRYAMCLP